jgi:hypothetical protein
LSQSEGRATKGSTHLRLMSWRHTTTATLSNSHTLLLSTRVSSGSRRRIRADCNGVHISPAEGRFNKTTSRIFIVPTAIGSALWNASHRTCFAQRPWPSRCFRRAPIAASVRHKLLAPSPSPHPRLSQKAGEKPSQRFHAGIQVNSSRTTAIMATSTSTLTNTSIATALDMSSESSSLHRRKPSEHKANGHTTQRPKDTKYRHVFATHAQQRTSCLSQDAESSPSFVGFRNLMVLVLRKPLLTMHNARM